MRHDEVDTVHPTSCRKKVTSFVAKCWDDRENNFPAYRRVLLLFSFFFYLVDVGLDAWVAAEYYIADQRGTDEYAKSYLIATLVFIIGPCVILNLISWGLYTWGWLVYYSEKVKRFCTEKAKQLNYGKLKNVRDLNQQEGVVPCQGVFVIDWPKPSVRNSRRNGNTSFEMTDHSRNGNTSFEMTDHSRNGSTEERDNRNGENHPDFGLEFYPLDFIDTSEYIVVSLIHFLLLGYLFRMLRLVYLSSRKDKDIYNYDRYRDLSFLRLVESFLEAAPQTILQLYLLVVHTEAVLWYRIVTPISIIFSITSLALSVGDYFSAAQDVEHYDPPPPNQLRQNRLSWTAYIGVIVWHFLMIVSRALSFALFATIFGGYVFIVIGVHYVAMVYWMYWQQARVLKRRESDFDDEGSRIGGEGCCNWCSWLLIPFKKLFDNYGLEIIVAMFNVFFHFKIRDGGSQFTLIPFYLLTFVENSLMIFLWYFSRDMSTYTWYAIPAIVAVFATYLVGLVVMVFYYLFGLPSRGDALIPELVLDHPVMTATLSRMYDKKVERGNFFTRVFRSTKSLFRLENT